MTHAQEQAALVVPDQSSRWRIWLARCGWLFVVLLLTTIFIASAPSAAFYERQDWRFADAVVAVGPSVSGTAFAALVVAAQFATLAVFYIVSLLIAFRKWDDWFALFVSAALLIIAWGYVARSDSSTYVFPLWLNALKPALTFLLQIGFVLSWTLLFFLLPDGRFVPRWSGWFVLLLLPGTFLGTLSGSYSSVFPSQYREQIAEFGWGVFFVCFVLVIIAGLLSQAYRYRNVATLTQRQQMKWILIGLAAQPLPLLFGISGGGGPWGAVLSIFLPLFIVALLPITIGLAVFRRRLWDVDPLINRSLVYGGLTLLVLGLYVVLVGLAFVFFGETSNLYLAALAVGVAALLAQPIRTRLQRAVNRLMYGDRDDPATVLSRLGDRLATAAAPNESLTALVETITQALKLPYAAVEDGRATLAESGHSPPTVLRLPLSYQSVPVGEMVVGQRSLDEAFSRSDRRLLDNIAQQAGAAVYAVQLTGRLQQSREQLVLAREEERRRLQRDLHDGLGPQLATLSMQLEVARRLVVNDPSEAEALLARLTGESQAAIADIRRLVYELRPPALDQLGLAGALREYAAGQNGGIGTQIIVEAPDVLPPLPAAVEVAAYRIAREAVNNCLRHAAAGECRIQLLIDAGLRLEIRDDGRGLPETPAIGLGLASMRERAAEVGGECRIEHAAGGGTAVTAFFPLAKEPSA